MQYWNHCSELKSAAHFTNKIYKERKLQVTAEQITTEQVTTE